MQAWSQWVAYEKKTTPEVPPSDTCKEGAKKGSTCHCHCTPYTVQSAHRHGSRQKATHSNTPSHQVPDLKCRRKMHFK